MSHEEQAGVEPAHPLFRDSPVFETGALPFGHCSSAGIPSSFTPVRGDFTFGCALGGVTRIRTEGSDLEGRSVRPLTLWMLYMVLQERFELITDMILNQVPLPIGLLEHNLVAKGRIELPT